MSIIKQLLEVEIVTDISDSKSKSDLDWADGHSLLGEKIDLFLPQNRKYLSKYLIASGSIGAAEWLFIDVKKIDSQFSYDDISVRDVTYSRMSPGATSLVNKYFGGNRSIAKYLIGMPHLHITTGADTALVVIVNQKVNAFVTFNKRASSYSVETAISKGGPVKLHEVYAALIKQEDIIITSSSQSEGGINLWMRLSKMPGIVVHGWDKNKQEPVNLGPAFTDPEETHAEPAEIYGPADYIYNKSDEHDMKELDHVKSIYKMMLVASKKKGGRK